MNLRCGESRWINNKWSENRNDAQLTDMAVTTAQPSRGKFDTTAEAGLVVHQQHCQEDPSPPSATHK
eukprot:scaffold39069_cov154-Skeletonema_marinoi.AAC.5